MQLDEWVDRERCKVSKDSGINYQRGVIMLVILSLLSQEDMYGYQLVQEMSQQSYGALNTKEGSLYPILYKLLDQGYVSDRKVLVGRRMTRVYYHLEPRGKEYLQALTEEYRAVARGVQDILERGERNG